MSKAHLTAISRKTASAPLKKLLKKELVNGRVLDFGCGRGKDVQHLTDLGFEVHGFDPHWEPRFPDGKFDTVLCTYVLNVVKPEERQDIVNALLDLSKETGSVYVTVRRDLKEDYVKTSKGTEQWLVYLPYPVVHEDSGSCIYKVK